MPGLELLHIMILPFKFFSSENYTSELFRSFLPIKTKSQEPKAMEVSGFTTIGYVHVCGTECTTPRLTFSHMIIDVVPLCALQHNFAAAGTCNRSVT